MTDEQLDFVNSFVEMHLAVFDQVRDEHYGKIWRVEVQILYDELKAKIIEIVVKYILKPDIEHFIRRDNCMEDELIKNEISKIVDTKFNEWKQRNT